MIVVFKALRLLHIHLVCMYISKHKLIISLVTTCLLNDIGFSKLTQVINTRKYSIRGVPRDKYSTRQSRVLYLSQDTSLSAAFFVHTSTGSALGGILYFELLLSHYHS